ncbi:hypothetical protein [Thermanaerovibrio velox]|uniref:hypothetical protein n=1 Tax=Thermanaerovibrio velox TaxID=108007 RepID=UPI00155A673B|nr:hypothetical protein [Thermanaerovibrio velox]
MVHRRPRVRRSTSNRKNLKPLWRIVLLALLVGILWGVESNINLMRMLGVTVVPPGLLPEEAVWSILTPTERRFWPLAAFRSEEIAERLESRVPVSAEVSIANWGWLRFRVSPLHPRAMVMWKGRFWLWASEGKVWPASLPQNVTVKGMVYPSGPVVYWDTSMDPLFEGASVNREVMPSNVPLVKIMNILDVIRSIRVSDAGLKGLKVLRGDESPIGIAIYVSGDAETMRVMFPIKDEAGAERIFRVLKILKEKGAISGDQMLVDCTYKDKIILRK